MWLNSPVRRAEVCLFQRGQRRHAVDTTCSHPLSLRQSSRPEINPIQVKQQQQQQQRNEQHYCNLLDV